MRRGVGRKILKLAKDRFFIAEYAYSKELYNPCASELYFALFTLMRTVLTEGQGKRWKHIGIFSEFSRKCIEEEFLSKKTLKEIGQVYLDLYHMRRKVDYGEGLYSFDIESLGDYLSLVREVFKVVKSRMDL